jgi:hypothetical protein
MRSRGGAVLLALAASLSAACRRAETPPTPPGMLDSEGKPIQARPAAPAPPAAPRAPEPTVYDFERPAPPAPSAAQNLGMAPSAAAATQPSEPARDLSAELSAALNQMTDCVDAAQAAQRPNGRLVVSVSAYVMGTGGISRATIDAPGQPAEALACFQRRLLAAKLREPVVGAPINVRGSAEVEVKAAGPRPTATTPPAAPAAPAGDVARGEPGDVARPDQSDLAGPP